MKLTTVRLCIIAVVAVAMLVCDGCATRGYVDHKCYETNRKAREYSRECAWGCLDRLSDVEDKVEKPTKN